MSETRCAHPKPWMPSINVTVETDATGAEVPGKREWIFRCETCGKETERQPGTMTGADALRHAAAADLRPAGHGGAPPKEPTTKQKIIDRLVGLPQSAREIQQPTAAQLAGAPLDLETAKAMLAKMTVYAEQVEHQLKAAEKGFQDLAEMVGPREAGYADVWSSIELLKNERDAYKKAKAENDERFMLERDAAREEARLLLKQLKDFGRDALKVMSLYTAGSDEARALSALVATALSTREYRAEHPKLCGAEWGGSGHGERVRCTLEPEHEGKHSAPLKVLSW